MTRSPIYCRWYFQIYIWRRHDRDRMVAGLTTISAYHHSRFEFESRSWRGVLDKHYVIKFVSDLRYVGGILRILRFPQTIKLTATI